MNGLHGVLIFCVLVLCRRRIRKELAGKRILCFMAPASWSQIEYPEEEHLNVGDGNRQNKKPQIVISFNNLIPQFFR